jgi:hypothetical protein
MISVRLACDRENRKHLDLNCIRPFVRRLCLFSSAIYRGTSSAPSVRPPHGESRTAQAEACGPLVGEPQTAREEWSPLLAKEESSGEKRPTEFCLIDSTST